MLITKAKTNTAKNNTTSTTKTKKTATTDKDRTFTRDTGSTTTTKKSTPTETQRKKTTTDRISTQVKSGKTSTNSKDKWKTSSGIKTTTATSTNNKDKWKSTESYQAAKKEWYATDETKKEKDPSLLSTGHVQADRTVKSTNNKDKWKAASGIKSASTTYTNNKDKWKSSDTMKEAMQKRSADFENSRAMSMVSAVSNGVVHTAAETAGNVAYALSGAERKNGLSAAESKLERLEKELKNAKTSQEKSRLRGQIERAKQAVKIKSAGEDETMKTIAEQAYDSSTHYVQESTKARERAKDGLNKFEQMAVDAGISTLESAVDGIIGAATGTGMLAFALRAGAGSSAQMRIADEEAGRESNFTKRMLYAGAMAAKEVFTEKLFGVTSFGKLAFKHGSLDDIVEKGVLKGVERAVEKGLNGEAIGGILTLLASMGGEGLEEVIGDLMEIPIEHWFNGKEYPQTTEDWIEVISNAAQDFLIGSMSGGLGAGMSANVWHYDINGARTEVFKKDVNRALERGDDAGVNKAVADYAERTAQQTKQETPEEKLAAREQNAKQQAHDRILVGFQNLGQTEAEAAKNTATIEALKKGETVSNKAITNLKLNNPESRRIFTEATGVQFPDGPATAATLRELARSAVQKAQERTERTKNIVSDISSYMESLTERMNKGQEQQSEKLAGSEGTISVEGHTYDYETISNAIRQQFPDATEEQVQYAFDKMRSIVDDHNQVMRFGQSGQEALNSVLTETQEGNRADILNEAEAYYNAGVKGQDVKSVHTAQAAQLSKEQRRTLYEAGKTDQQNRANKFKEKAEKVTTAGKNSGLTENGRKYAEKKWGKEKTDKLDRFAKALGTTLDFTEAVDGGLANANINGTDVKIEMDNENPVLALLGHELLHRMQEISPERYYEFREAIRDRIEASARAQMEAYEHIGEHITFDEALDEAAADYAGRMIENTELLDEFLAEHKENKGLLRTLRDAIKHIIDRIRGIEPKYGQDAMNKLNALLNESAETVSGLETAERSENPLDDTTARDSIKSLTEASGLNAEYDEDGKIVFTYGGKSITEVTAKHIKENSALGSLITAAKDSDFISAKDAEKQYKGMADIMNMVMTTQNPDLVWDFTGAAIFSAYKSNADGQYSTTVDFSTVCRKTQDMIDAMSRSMVKLGRGLTKSEVTQLQQNLIEEGSPVPCPVCYVFSRWAGVGSLLDTMWEMQTKYENFTTEEVQAAYDDLMNESRKLYPKMVDKKTGKPNSDGIKKMRSKLADEQTSLNAKLESLEQQKQTKAVVKQKAEIEARLAEIDPQLDMCDKLTWFEYVRLAPDYKPMPKDILFALNRGAEFAADYPGAWKYRTTRGSGMGKAIMPYADMRAGDMIVGTGDTTPTGKQVLEDFKRPSGELTKTQQKAIAAAQKRTAAQNLIGGQRYQSTSDFRYDYALDYLQSFFELQAMGGKIQTYTKIVEYAEMIASIGGDVNLSVMPRNKGYENGHLIYSNVTGINYDAAVKAAHQFDSAQLILVGINDEHIKLALEDSTETGGIEVTFVIPYHASGASEEFIAELVKHLGEEYTEKNYQDYSKVQTDTERSDSTEENSLLRDLRKGILTGKNGSKSWAPTFDDLKLIDKESTDILGRSFDDLRGVEKRALAGDTDAIAEYKSWTAGNLKKLYNKMWTGGGVENGVRLASNQAAAIMPHEYWDKRTTRENAYINGFLFRSYCYNLGLHPRFTGMSSGSKYMGYGDFSDSTGYWKTLIDRAMYDNNGNYRDQQRINVTNFDKGMLKPEYAEEHWGEYKVDEPSLRRAEAAADKFVEAVKDKETAAKNGTPKEELEYDSRRSIKVEDKDTLKFLNEQMERGEYDPVKNPNGGYITVYRSFLKDGDKLYSPMNSDDLDTEKMTEGGNRKYKRGYSSQLGVWEQSTESLDVAQKYMDENPAAKYAKFDLKAIDNSTGGVAYNPYLHASNLVLNDQFSAAYRRNLVTVECRVPVSELGGTYQAQYAKDPTGWAKWKAGGVSALLAKSKPELRRKLFLSRWMLPVREMSPSEVADIYADYFDGLNIPIPWNVVTPELRHALVEKGLPISYKDVKISDGNFIKFEDKFPGEVGESESRMSLKTSNMTAQEMEDRILELEKQAEDLNERIDLAEFNDEDATALERELTKVYGELDGLRAEERRAVVKTPMQEILDNLSKYRITDLYSLAEQLSEGEWDGYEELSRSDLEDGIREMIENREYSPLEMQAKKYGLFVRPVENKARASLKSASDLSRAIFDAQEKGIAEGKSEAEIRADIREAVNEQTKQWDAESREKLDNSALAWEVYHKKAMRKQQADNKEKLNTERAKSKQAVREAVQNTRDVERAKADLNMTAELIEQTKQRRAEKAKYEEKLKAAHQEKLDAVREAVQNTRDVERAKAELQHEADIMNERRNAAKRSRTAENAYNQLKEKNKKNRKLRSNRGRNTLRDRNALERRRTAIETEQGAIDTIRKNPKLRKEMEDRQKEAKTLRTIGRKAYADFCDDANAVERVANRQQCETTAAVRLTSLRSCASTMETMFVDGLVNRKGDKIGGSMKEVFLCLDENGNAIEEDQAILQDFMLHWHNIDRMTIEERADARLDTFELQNPWLAEMSSNDLAELMASSDKELEKLGKQDARKKAEEYLVLVRDYLNAKNKAVFPDKNGNPITALTSQQVVKKYLEEQPWVLEKAKGIYDWWDQFMREWAVGESISLSEYEHMHAIYPHYVPTYREMRGMGGATAFDHDSASVQKAVKKAKGGLSEIKNIEDSYRNLVNKIVKQTRTNELFRNLIDTAMLDEDGTFEDLMFYDWSQDAGRGEGNSVELTNGEITSVYTNGFEMKTLTDSVDETSVQKVENPNGGFEYKITAWYDGKQRSLYVSEELFNSVQAIMGKATTGFEGMVAMGNRLTGWSKNFITGINPAFAVRNVARDLQTAMVNSTAGVGILKYVPLAVKEMKENSEHWQRYNALGGGNAMYYNDSTAFMQQVASDGTQLSEYFAGKNKYRAAEVAKQAGKFADKAQDVVGKPGEVTEAMTRFAEYLATVDRLGDTYAGRLQGIRNAAEVTVDFSRHGKYGKAINAWVPYWNPQMQGMAKMVRMCMEGESGQKILKQAGKTLSRAAMQSVMLEMVHYFLLKLTGGYDDWEEMDDRTKDAYFCFYLGDHKFLKLPRGREWGQILGVPIMRMLEYANGRENPFENYLDTAIKPNFDVNPLDSVFYFSTKAELKENKDFAGRTIIPYAYQNVAKKDQWNDETTIYNKTIGQALGKILGENSFFSPMEADYFLESWLGDFWKTVMMDPFTAANWKDDAGNYSATTGLENLGKTLLEKSFGKFAGDNRYSNYATNTYYSNIDSLDKKIQNMKNRDIDGSEDWKDTKEYQAQQAISKTLGKDISALNRKASSLPDGEEKDAVKEQIIDLAEQANQLYDDIMSGKETNAVDKAAFYGLPDDISKELSSLVPSVPDGKTIAPTTNKPSSYADPNHSGRYYKLDDAAKDQYKVIYMEVYEAEVRKLTESYSYQSLSDERKVEKLIDARETINKKVKKQLIQWMKDHDYKSEPK